MTRVEIGPNRNSSIWNRRTPIRGTFQVWCGIFGNRIITNSEIYGQRNDLENRLTHVKVKAH